MKKNGTKTKAIVINITLLLLVLLGLGLVFNANIRNWMIGNQTNKYTINHISKADVKKNEKVKGDFDFEKVEPLASDKILKEQVDALRGEASQLPVIGGIAIPELNINLPIFKGIGNTGLMFGAGTMKENQKMGEGNYALASHHIFGTTGSSDLLFSPLDNAKDGQKIYVTDKEHIYEYTITSVDVVDPSAGYVINDVPGKKLITLVTCTDAEATERIIVQGELTNTSLYETNKDKFDQQYNQINL